MLTPDEKQAIEAELAHYDQKRGVVPEALKIVQRARRWVSGQSVGDIAEFLGLTSEEVDHVATFYSLIFRQPVGRHVILLCDSVSCYIMGYGPLAEHLSRRLGITWGQTTADGRFTLLPVACLGACDHAPAMMIDDDLHGDLTATKVDEVLAKYE
jgi:NADH-quinone oxidoreductase subunit E